MVFARSAFELVIGVGGIEVMRLPLPPGTHRVGRAPQGALKLGALQGSLHVAADGVRLRDESGGEQTLSQAPTRVGDLELCIEPLAVDDGTATHEERAVRPAYEVVRIVELPGERAVARLSRSDLAVGTDETCRIRLASLRVSRVHCWIYRRGDRVFVRDAGSKNGTFINGIRITEAEAHLPAHVRVGDVELRLESESAARVPEDVAPYIIGRSAAIETLLSHIERFARAEAPVLITGESGSGKELVARALHERSPRGPKPFVAVNCGALAPTLIESELFGHTRGAFTGASERRLGAFVAAAGGTLFLDEIGELPLHLQPMLLRVLETREVRAVGDDRPTAVDARVVAATHRDLRAAVQQGRFREDLFHRLTVLKIAVPPLRERGRDIELLAQHFARTLAADRRVVLSPGALDRLNAHPFPGNIRELRNVIHRALYVSDCDTIMARDLDLEPLASEADLAPIRDLSALERSALLHALRETRGSRSEAARRLGVARSTVYRKMAALGIDDAEVFQKR